MPDRTVFRIHVGDIVSVSAEKQMVWPHAGSVVALMADMHPGWDCSMGQLPRKAMGSNRFVVHLQPTVSVIAYGIVVPATSGLVNLFPETVLNRPAPTGIGTDAATEASSPTFDFGGLRLKLLATVKACHCDAGLSHVQDVAQETSHR
jgi:hypothetical protein